MEIIKYIGSLAIGIGVLLILGHIMSFITGGISKLFNTTSTLNGKIVATPDTLDENLRELKELKNKFIKAYQKFNKKRRNKELNITEQVTLLENLSKLKDNGIVNEIEYQELKKEILKK